MAKSDKPALHAAPLDAVPMSPMLTKDTDSGATMVDGSAEMEPVSHIAPSDPVRVESPELKMASIDSMDFAGAVGGTEDNAPDEVEKPETES